MKYLLKDEDLQNFYLQTKSIFTWEQGNALKELLLDKLEEVKEDEKPSK